MNDRLAKAGRGAGGNGSQPSVVHRLLSSSALFHYARLPAYWGTMERLARAVALAPGERLLDVGCGTGIGARLGGQAYVGIDTDVSHLRFGRSQLRQSGRSFAGMSALALAFRDGAFDKAVLINMIHHLDEATIARLLLELERVVRSRIIVLDAAPDSANAISRFFLAHDRGEYIRPVPVLRGLLAARFEVAHEEVFHNRLRYVSQVMFTLVPRRSRA